MNGTDDSDTETRDAAPDAILALMQPIDRDAFTQVIFDWVRARDHRSDWPATAVTDIDDCRDLADVIRAFVTPAIGITLTAAQVELHRDALSTAAWVSHHLKPEREAEFSAEWDRLGGAS